MNVVDIFSIGEPFNDPFQARKGANDSMSEDNGARNNDKNNRDGKNKHSKEDSIFNKTL
jgi:hypothetical protein